MKLLGVITFFVMFLSSLTYAQQSPNILLILVDDLGWTDTSVRMDPNIPESKSDFYQTPSIEALASAGMRFSNFYASSPACSPTRASIQTGKTPAQLQMTDILDGGEINSVRRQLFYHNHPLIPPMPLKKLSNEEVTIAEYLKAGNPSYRTSHIQKWDLVMPQDRLPQFQDITMQGYDVANTGFGMFPAGTDPKENLGATLRATTFIEQTVAMGRPFFTQVSYSSVHVPYEAKQTTIDKYRALSPGQRHDQPLYAAMVEELDTVVGMLMQKLDQLGIADNTYVVFTSDNGGESDPRMGTENDPLFHGKGSIWEGGLRVPMIVKGPGIQANSVSDVPAVTYDLFSTFGEMAGINVPQPHGVEGTSLLGILKNGGQLPLGSSALSRAYGPNGELFFHYPHYIRDTGEGPRTPASAIRDGAFKLVKIYGENGNPDKIFLFDLSANITESDNVNSPVNLANVLPVQTEAMLDKLETWLAAVNAPLPVPAGGDFDGNGVVDNDDLKAWQANYGKIGALHSEGDANGDAINNGRDFLVWQKQFFATSANFDNNSTIDQQDLAIWQNSYGLNSGGDADGDNDSDGRDFLYWQRHLVQSGSLAESYSAVPEPSSLLLTATFLLSVSCLRRC